jgi:acyl carrier protein
VSTIDFLIELIKKMYKERVVQVTPESDLTGENGILDSLGVIEVGVALEDYSRAQNFSFKWNLEEIFSEKKNIFKNIKTLADEFDKQQSSQIHPVEETNN